ncbi:hypothetical protein RJ641_005577, partial [Dillenia turbinata]
MQDKIMKEISSYKNKAGDFGRKMAMETGVTLLPGEDLMLQRNPEQDPLDTISLGNVNVVDDWVTVKEMLLRGVWWCRLVDANTRLLNSSTDETEVLCT